MKYVKIDENRRVREIIPMFVEEFPNIPITQRYSEELLSQCLEVAEEVKVNQNDEYLPLENRFISSSW